MNNVGSLVPSAGWRGAASEAPVGARLGAQPQSHRSSHVVYGLDLKTSS